MSWSIVEFESGFDRESFDCGSSSLNDYIRKYVSQDMKRRLTRAYVALAQGGDKIVGYYTVSSAQIVCQEFPERWKKRVGVYPVPCSLVGRLAVDRSAQGQGLGETLLMHACETIEAAAKHIGIRAVIVDAENKRAEEFYTKYGFEYLQARPDNQGKRTLFLPLK